MTVAPLLERVGDRRAFLAGGHEEAAVTAVCAHERTGHPLDDNAFDRGLGKNPGSDTKPLEPRRPERRQG